ncbi:MAG: hypothetical protein WC412_08305 [Candidatus Omnitrophota bacterium]|jgi:hypothetical protein
MVKFGEIISGSLEWTITVLFRPFSPKKWLILGFVAFLGGALIGGNLNLHSNRDYHTKEAKAEQLYSQRSLDQSKTCPLSNVSQLKDNIKSYLQKIAGPDFVFVFTAIAFAIFLILLLFLWLGARFHFIFLEDVTKNDASIIAPFKSNRGIGNSFFRFHILLLLISLIIFVLIVLGCIMALFKIGIFNPGASPDFLKILSALSPFILLLVVFLVISIFIYIIVNDLALVVMYKDRIGIIAAIKKVLSLLGANKLNFLLYVLIKWGLAVCAYLIYNVVYFVTFLGLLFPALTAASFLYFIYKIIPKDVQSVFLAVVVIIAIPIILFLWYCFMCISLPFAVFFRTFSIKFLGKLDSRYNLFVYTDISSRE